MWADASSNLWLWDNAGPNKTLIIQMKKSGEKEDEEAGIMNAIKN